MSGHDRYGYTKRLERLLRQRMRMGIDPATGYRAYDEEVEIEFAERTLGHRSDQMSLNEEVEHLREYTEFVTAAKEKELRRLVRQPLYNDRARVMAQFRKFAKLREELEPGDDIEAAARRVLEPIADIPIQVSKQKTQTGTWLKILRTVSKIRPQDLELLLSSRDSDIRARGVNRAAIQALKTAMESVGADQDTTLEQVFFGVGGR